MSKTVGLILAMQNQVSPQLKKIAESLNMTDKEFKKLQNSVKKAANEVKKNFNEMKNACAPIVAGFTAMAAAGGMMINKTVEAGDRIDKMSQKLQMSRQTFQEMDYVFTQNGANIESMGKSMVTLSKAVVGVTQGNKSNAATFRQLGISVKDSGGKLKSTENIMFEVLEKLQKMPDNANRAALATQLFGKSAMELQPLLNSGAKSIGELRQKYQDLGMGMSDTAVDSAVKFKDTMDTIQRSLQGAMYQIGADILPSIQAVADAFINNMPKIKATVEPIMKALASVFKFCAEHIDLLINIATFAITTFAAFKSIMVIVGIVKTFTAVIQAITIAQGIWNAVMLANPIGIVAVAIAGLIGGIVLLIKNFDKVKAVWQKVVDAFKVGIEWIKEHWQYFGPLGLLIKGGSAAIGKIQDLKNNNTPKYASGTSSSLGGTALVGENGPELVNLPTGSKVYNSNETKNIMNKDIVINLNIGGNVIGNGEFIEQIKMVLGKELRTAMAV